MLNKNAQSMSLNVVIVAAIALLVLVILSVIFMGRMGLTSRETISCASQGGQCSYFSCESGYHEFTGAKCFDSDNKADPNQRCCMPIETG